MYRPFTPAPTVDAPPIVVAFAPSHRQQVRALLTDSRVARAFFGQVLRDEALDAWIADNWEATLEADECRLVALGTHDGRVLGAGCVAEGTLSYVVAPTDWRRGIGITLARELCAQATRDPRGRSLSAIVFRENRASAALLEQLGFRFAGLSHAVCSAFAARERLRYVLSQSDSEGTPEA